MWDNRPCLHHLPLVVDVSWHHGAVDQHLYKYIRVTFSFCPKAGCNRSPYLAFCLLRWECDGRYSMSLPSRSESLSGTLPADLWEYSQVRDWPDWDQNEEAVTGELRRALTLSCLLARCRAERTDPAIEYCTGQSHHTSRYYLHGTRNCPRRLSNQSCWPHPPEWRYESVLPTLSYELSFSI